MGLSPSGLADTSFFIAVESGRTADIDKAPPVVAISVVTLAELRSGVLSAPDDLVRRRRQATLDSASSGTILAIDTAVAEVWADMRAHLAGTGRRLPVNDIWIAATAAVHHLPVVTQDDDFDVVEGVRGLEIIKV